MILLTGFEPFGGFTANPAGEVAKALDGRAFGTEVVRGAILPVHHADAASAVSRLVDELAPRAIVHLGLAGGRARIALERVAVNVMDFEIADNAGYRASGEPCVAGGPVAYFSTLPLGAILEALVAERHRDRAANYGRRSPVRSLRKARSRRFISSGISTSAARPAIRMVARSVRR